MKRVISILLTLLLILTLCSCSYTPSDPERNLSYKSEFSEETLKIYDESAKKIIEEKGDWAKEALRDLLSLEGTLSIDSSVYFVQRTLCVNETKKALKEQKDCPVVLYDHAFLLIPVFETDPTSNSTRIVGQINAEGAVEPLFQQELTENTYGFIYQRADSIQTLEVLCQSEQLGTLKNATILSFDHYGDTILLETDTGWYIFDPLYVKEQLEPGLLACPVAKYDDEPRIYDCADFLEIYFNHLQEVKQQTPNLLKSFFEELIEQVFS